MVQYSLLAGGASFTLALYFFLKRRRNESIYSLPLPPGPKKRLLIGNLLDMPKGLEWVTFHKWCKEFDSDIIHLNVVGTSVVVLDTADAASELLERRSSIYSSRPRMPMLNELMGWDYNFAFMPYGDTWRHHRKVMHEAFHPAAVRRYRPLQLKAAHGLLCHMLEEPESLLGHLRQMAGATILSIAYGIDVLPKNDPYLAIVEEGFKPAAVAAVPGTFLVDIFPWLKYVPDWMPFAGFKRKAKEWRKLTLAMIEKPFEAGKQKFESGDIKPSFLSYGLETMNENHTQEEVIMGVAGTMFSGGSDTTISAIASCVFALVTHPEVLKKAQAEIDGIVGLDRLPDFDDFDSLPYITAIATESLRWRESAPIGLPHILAVDDVYKGYRVPAGSIVIANVWAMLHDETAYPEPFEFKPERFMKDGCLNPDVIDPAHACFGFGRRICPGRHMAFSTVWIAIATLIAAFSITKAVDENGEVIEPSQEYVSATVMVPLPFKYSIKPRSKQAEALIHATATMDY